jgi:hypothetical protein
MATACGAASKPEFHTAREMPGRNLQARHSACVGHGAPGSKGDLDIRERRTLPVLRRGVEAGDAAKRGRPADAVLAETA